MSRREFLQLAHTYDSVKHQVGGWYLSEKLDGMRAYWDGGWTRGKLTSQVPFANTTKDYIRVKSPHSTGLWSRYGKSIFAPEWFLDSLPVGIPLDGELYAGRGNFQQVMSTVKKYTPIDDEWKKIKYMIFDLPSDYAFLAPGRISVPQWKEELEDMRHHVTGNDLGPINFRKVNYKLGNLSNSDIYQVVPQILLPPGTIDSEAIIAEELDVITTCGGEGLVVRKPSSIWETQRTWNMLKIKTYIDDEATVVGYVWGKGKLENLMGALVIKWGDIQFELSGFTEAERVLTDMSNVRTNGIPGKDVSLSSKNNKFPRGSIVTFRYRELTNAGVPKEARFHRKG